MKYLVECTNRAASPLRATMVLLTLDKQIFDVACQYLEPAADLTRSVVDYDAVMYRTRVGALVLVIMTESKFMQPILRRLDKRSRVVLCDIHYRKYLIDVPQSEGRTNFPGLYLLRSVLVMTLRNKTTVGKCDFSYSPKTYSTAGNVGNIIYDTLLEESSSYGVSPSSMQYYNLKMYITECDCSMYILGAEVNADTARLLSVADCTKGMGFKQVGYVMAHHEDETAVEKNKVIRFLIKYLQELIDEK